MRIIMTPEEKFNMGFDDFILKFVPYEEGLQVIIRNRKIQTIEDINLFLKDFNIIGTETGDKIFKDMIQYVG